MNHIVRPEDWPVMPVQQAGFSLKPWGFFERNPALDVPLPVHCADDEHMHEHRHTADDEQGNRAGEQS
jgi:primary-amine oxidase